MNKWEIATEKQTKTLDLKSKTNKNEIRLDYVEQINNVIPKTPPK
jgi:hypothetical protein